MSVAESLRTASSTLASTNRESAMDDAAVAYWKSLGLGWHGTATTGGVLGADVATSLYETTTATQAAVFLASLGVIYQSLAAATAPKAAAPAKQKKA